MSSGLTLRWTDLAALLLLIGFVALGLHRVDTPGIYQDEALIAFGAFPEWGEGFYRSAPGFGGEPVMLLSYLGALKAWLWRGLLMFVEPSAFWLRCPALLLGALGLGFAYLVAKHTLGAGAAVAGLALAVTDPIVYWTTRIDWGPVVLQRLLLAGGLWIVIVGHKRNSRLLPLGAGVLFGLGIWDKLTFIWLLGALAVAATLAIPWNTWRDWLVRNTAPLAVGLLIGASPFLAYRLTTPDAPSSVVIETHSEHLVYKAATAHKTLNGTLLEWWAARLDGDPEAHPRAWHNLVLLAGSVGALFFLRGQARFRAMLFAGVFWIASWSANFVLEGAGQIHHLALSYPAPQLLAGAVFVAFWKRVRWAPYLCAALLSFSCANSLRVSYAPYALWATKGTTPLFSEAVYDLHAELAKHKADRVAAVHWGFVAALGYLSGGQLETLELYSASDPSDARQHLDRIFDEPGRTAIVAYAPGAARYMPIPEMLPEAAQPPTFTVRDALGREVYVVRIVDRTTQ